ncbi:MAG: ribbon-helix-helix protein, CopG family [Sarcina sp.]
MAVKDKKNPVKGILAGINETGKSNLIANDKTNEEPVKMEAKSAKSTRGRKKKSTEVALEFKGKKLKITNLNKEIIKCNKTFYLEKKYIDILEELSNKTGMTTSELVQVAIQLLHNNVELEGFE